MNWKELKKIGIEMWQEIVDRKIFKKSDLSYKTLKAIEDMCANCPLCEYYIAQKNGRCEKCPLPECVMKENNPYDKWCDDEDISGAEEILETMKNWIPEGEEMNREDAKRELEEAKRRIEKAEEYLRANPEDKRIMVPDNIHLSAGTQILFNDDKQILSDVSKDGYDVTTRRRRFSHEPHYLIPADENNLEVGKIYYRSNCGMRDIGNLARYGIYDGKYLIYISSDIETNKVFPDYSTIMQAVPVRD